MTSGFPANERPDGFTIAFFEGVLKRLPRDLRILEILASLYTRAGRVSDGLRLDRRIVRLDPSNPTAHYNLACSLSLRTRKKEAVESLREAVSLGYRDFDWMLEDEDLAPLRTYRPFRELVAELTSRRWRD